MMELVFATTNEGKKREVQEMMPQSVSILSLDDINWDTEIEETENTLQANALLKARTIFEHTGRPCFADDTGLIVDALGGRPGVLSARYAGPDADSEMNMAKMLDELEGVQERQARFVTFIALVMPEEHFLFRGAAEGTILENRRGEGGFGYDPLFMPTGHSLTFAEMTLTQKATISHRGRAFQKFIHFLERIS